MFHMFHSDASIYYVPLLCQIIFIMLVRTCVYGIVHMCVCVCVCMCVCVCGCVRACVHVCLYVSVYLCLSVLVVNPSYI